MLSLVKRNSSIIAITKKAVVSKFDLVKVSIYKNLVFKWRSYDLMCCLASRLKGKLNFSDFVVEEYKDYVVIGLKPSSLCFVPNPLNNDVLLRSICNNIPNDFFSISDKLKRVQHSFEKLSLIEGSEEFKEIEKFVSEKASSVKFKIIFNSGNGMFSKVKGCELPIVLLDFKKRKIYYHASIASYKYNMIEDTFDSLISSNYGRFCLPVNSIVVLFVN